MIVYQAYFSMVLVSLPSINVKDYKLNKHDYTPPTSVCQQEKQLNTIEYNYITTERFLESNNIKYMDITR